MDRPLPPTSIGQFVEGGGWADAFVPAPDVTAWAIATFLTEGAALYNEDHAHLEGASIQFLWADSSFLKQGRTVVGQCEEVAFRCGAWQRGRQEQQMMHWFGQVPDFIITLAADYSATCSDADFCALVEHELYHVGQAKDEYGVPKFTRDGMPKLTIRGHDVEEFLGVVRRYGASGATAALVDAAKRPPEVAKINIARACGTCLLKSA